MEHHDLNLTAMGQALRDFGDRAAGAEWAVVFYAGHGIEMNGTNYLVPVDAQLKRDAHVPDEALSLDRVQAKVEAASKFGLVILDACRNNPFLARMARTGTAEALSGDRIGRHQAGKKEAMCCGQVSPSVRGRAGGSGRRSEERVTEVRIQDAHGCQNISRVGHYGPPDGWQMRHASRFIFGITQLAAVQFRWRGPCAQLASRLG